MQTQTVSGQTRSVRRAPPHSKATRKGASGPFSISATTKRAEGGQPTTSNPVPKPPNGKSKSVEEGNGKKTPVSATPAVGAGKAAEKPDDGKKPAQEPALIVFGLTEKGAPQASWFSGVDAEVAIRTAQLLKFRALAVKTPAQRDLLPQLRQGQVFAGDRLFAPVIQQSLYEELTRVAGDPKGDAAPPPAPPNPRDWAAIKVGSMVLGIEDAEDGWGEALVLEVNEHLLRLRWVFEPRWPAFIKPRTEVALLPPGA
jgi:hypothetical protein